MGEAGRVVLAKRYLQAAWGGDFATCDALMTPDVVFIDSAGDRLEGFAECSAAARAFHRLEPNRSLDIREAFQRGDAVMLRVDLLAEDPRLRGRYLISVCIRDGRVYEWQTHRHKPVAYSRALRRESSRAAVAQLSRLDKNR